MQSTQRYYLGIDTGGTFTDGVLLDPGTGKVLQSCKVLTTHHDLELCVGEVLERLTPAEPDQVALVAISTTLATNAIAEGKRRAVGLLLLGYDPELVQIFNFQSQFSTPYYRFVPGRHNLDGQEVEALDEAALRQAATEIIGKVEAFAVASFAGPVNPSHELRAAEILSEMTSLPIILAHHLSSELDSIRRATTASLNASLMYNTELFFNAIQVKLQQRGITCPVMAVKGDASLVKAELARRRPVEIIHSGPATSAIGGQYLAGVQDALVIDIGGTTTDLALVENGQVRIASQAATVASYRTCVRTVHTHSIGLGGDSELRFNPWGELSLGPQRVLPLAYLCQRDPGARRELLGYLSEKRHLRSSDGLEFWALRRKPDRPLGDAQLEALVQFLGRGARRRAVVLKTIGPIPPYLINELISQEIIERASLTPTDLLHVTGEYSPWDAGIAEQVVDAAALGLEKPVERFIAQVREQLTGMIVAEVLHFISGHALSLPPLMMKDEPLDRWLYRESLKPSNPYLGSSLVLKVPLVGIGAPAGAYLPPVAAALHTQIYLPEYYEVANAVGTVVGNVVVQLEGQVSPYVQGASVMGYIARAANLQQIFPHFEDALDFARQRLRSQAAEAATAAGAIQVSLEFEERQIWDGMVALTVLATGRPGNGKTETCCTAGE